MTSRPSIPTCAIILTHNRPELLDECVRAIHPQVDQVIVIDNASDPPAAPPWPEPIFVERGSAPLIVIRDMGQPANLSRLWRVGLEEAGGVERPGGPWGVAILCDDAIVPPGWVAAVATGIELGFAAACTHAITAVREMVVKREPDRDIFNRMTGWAFMLDGQRAHSGLNGVWPDERLEWWWGDTHLDWLARRAAGMAIMPGPAVPNARPNEHTVNRPELGHRAGLDGKEFEAIWGWRPW